jgi:hypothetical protein
MLKKDHGCLTGPGSGVRPRRNRAGSSVLSVLAGVALLCAGTTAAALAAAHSTGAATPSPVCRPLPATQSDRPVSFRIARHRAARVAPSVHDTTQAVELCVSVQAVAGPVRPGGTALYEILVSPVGGTVDGVSVQVSVTAGRSSPSLPAPAFTYCGDGDGTGTCTLGALAPPQASDLQAQALVPATAPSGDSVTLTAEVTGTASGSGSSGQVSQAATVDVVAPPPSSPRTTPPTHHHSGSSRHSKPHSSSSPDGGLQPGSLPSLSGPSGSVTAGNPSIEFPAIDPGPSPASASPAHRVKPSRGPYRASEAANILPLNGGQLDGQVAGLIVLVLGVALVILRISLRRPDRR